MKSDADLEALAAPLQDLSIDEKALLVQILGLWPAYCPGCLCTLGSPYCHPISTSILSEEDEPQLQMVCPAPCPAEVKNEEDDG